MAKCISCGRKNAGFLHYNDNYVCDYCVGKYFTCPDCGRLFDMGDYENGDQGSGFCKDCCSEH